jgi:predicted LPLAT superfamily acyltransferase
MHHPRHSFTIRNMRIAALMLCIKRLAIAVAIGFLLVSAMRADPRLSITGLSLLGATLLFTVIQWMFASAAKCPLCMMPVLSRKGCSRHRHAKSLFGSQRLRVALSILLKGSFRCPYCNEPTVLRLKALR